MHRKRFVFGITALFLVAGIVTAAEQGRSGAPKAAKPTTTAPKVAPSLHPTPKATKSAVTPQPKTIKPVSAAKPVQTAKPSPAKSTSTTAAKAAATKSAKPVAAKSVKTEKPAAATSVKADKPATTKVAKTEKPAATTAAKTDKTAKTAKSTASTTTTTTAVSTTPLTPVQEKLKKNTNLAAKLTSRLPAGTDLIAVSAGFRNLGQFVAAVNVSNNLGVSFTQLKTKMVTGGMSLGQAIQAVRPLTASPTVEAQRAEYDARGMIADSELQPQATAPTSPSTSSKTKVKTKTPTR
jgi:hypothetical protein